MIFAMKSLLLSSEYLLQLRSQAESGSLGTSWTVCEDINFYKGRIYLLQTTLIFSILSGCHNSIHEGIHKTLHRLRAYFFWQGMISSVQEFIASCPVCQTQ